MNILWIEDFGGRLGDDITSLLNLYFKDFVNFGDWDDDSYSIPSCPEDLPKYCKNIKSSHCIHLCRHFFDYQELKNNLNLAQKIDAIIIDIRLDNGVDFNMPIPEWTGDKSKFHSEAGFYIFNDLVHLGFPSEKICLMTGESGKLDAFDARRAEIYFPKVTSFTKNKEEELLRQWINSQATDYANLRRGVIDGCKFAKTLLPESLYFNQYIPNQYSLKHDDIISYFQILENFLPLREPENKHAIYKLFVRTLSHEWEASDPKKIKALAWIMKNVRNWVSHNSLLFGCIDEKLLAYLFIINLRLMFDFDSKVQLHETILLALFSGGLSEQLFKDKVKYDLLKPDIVKAYLDLKNKVLDEKGKDGVKISDGFYFNELANNIQQSNSPLKDDKQLFSELLYQMFWLTTSNPYVGTKDRKKTLEIKFHDFNYLEKPYIEAVARHIYNDSF